jgi:3-methyladenine DNA glycosylase/8-oxoguanine DNA glycosylase
MPLRGYPGSDPWKARPGAVRDLGIRAAVRKLYGLAEMPKPSEVDELARNWRPYATVASWYLWRSLENAPDL